MTSAGILLQVLQPTPALLWIIEVAVPELRKFTSLLFGAIFQKLREAHGFAGSTRETLPLQPSGSGGGVADGTQTLLNFA